VDYPNPTKRLPSESEGKPLIPIPRFVVSLIIGLETKDIEPVPAPTYGSETAREYTTEILPIDLTRRLARVPGFVVAVVVGAATEDIETVGGPGDGIGRAGENTTKILPACLRRRPAGVPGFVGHTVVCS
jgi:hypothetical protein